MAKGREKVVFTINDLQYTVYLDRMEQFNQVSYSPLPYGTRMSTPRPCCWKALSVVVVSNTMNKEVGSIFFSCNVPIG